jgi:hypothetical protein
MPVILGIWEAKIGMITILGHPKQRFWQDPISSNKLGIVEISACDPSDIGDLHSETKVQGWT